MLEEKQQRDVVASLEKLRDAELHKTTRLAASPKASSTHSSARSQSSTIEGRMVKTHMASERAAELKALNSRLKAEKKSTSAQLQIHWPVARSQLGRRGEVETSSAGEGEGRGESETTAAAEDAAEVPKASEALEEAVAADVEAVPSPAAPAPNMAQMTEAQQQQQQQQQQQMQQMQQRLLQQQEEEQELLLQQQEQEQQLLQLLQKQEQLQLLQEQEQEVQQQLQQRQAELEEAAVAAEAVAHPAAAAVAVSAAAQGLTVTTDSPRAPGAQPEPEHETHVSSPPPGPGERLGPHTVFRSDSRPGSFHKKRAGAAYASSPSAKSALTKQLMRTPSAASVGASSAAPAMPHASSQPVLPHIPLLLLGSLSQGPADAARPKPAPAAEPPAPPGAGEGPKQPAMAALHQALSVIRATFAFAQAGSQKLYAGEGAPKPSSAGAASAADGQAAARPVMDLRLSHHGLGAHAAPPALTQPPSQAGPKLASSASFSRSAGKAEPRPQVQALSLQQRSEPKADAEGAVGASTERARPRALPLIGPASSHRSVRDSGESETSKEHEQRHRRKSDSSIQGLTLIRLCELKEQDLVTEEEFERIKAALFQMMFTSESDSKHDVGTSDVGDGPVV